MHGAGHYIPGKISPGFSEGIEESCHLLCFRWHTSPNPALYETICLCRDFINRYHTIDSY